MGLIDLENPRFTDVERINRIKPHVCENGHRLEQNAVECKECLRIAAERVFSRSQDWMMPGKRKEARN